jgi:hypothetical protein
VFVDKGASVAATGVGNDLVESFTASYQPEIGAGTFFSRFETLLEIHHLRVERRVAVATATVPSTISSQRRFDK